MPSNVKDFFILILQSAFRFCRLAPYTTGCLLFSGCHLILQTAFQNHRMPPCLTDCLPILQNASRFHKLQSDFTGCFPVAQIASSQIVSWFYKMCPSKLYGLPTDTANCIQSSQIVSLYYGVPLDFAGTMVLQRVFLIQEKSLDLTDFSRYHTLPPDFTNCLLISQSASLLYKLPSQF